MQLRNTIMSFVLIIFSLCISRQLPAADKWWLELASGPALVAAADLNNWVSAQQNREIWLFQAPTKAWADYFGYQLISSQTGTYKQFKQMLTWAPRLGYRLNKTWSISIGVEIWNRQIDSNPESIYTFPSNTDYLQFTRTYNKFLLNCSGFQPQMSLSGSFAIGKKLSAGVTLGGGIIFAKLQTQVDSVTDYKVYNSVDNQFYSFQKETQQLGESGSGNGWGASLKARLNYQLLKKLGLFIEAGYSFRHISSFSGSGSRTYQLDEQPQVQEEWQGDWYMRQEKVFNNQVGSQMLVYPSCLPYDNFSSSKQGNFVLNLSGFALSGGIFIHF